MSDHLFSFVNNIVKCTPLNIDPLLQLSVSTKYYDEAGEEEKFIFTFFILFFQCVCSALISKSGMYILFCDCYLRKLYLIR